MINYELREKNKAYWNATADAWFGVTALPEYGQYFVTEDDLHLFGDVTGQKMLEVGCGSGHSLVYQAQHGAAELWGLDISESQLKNAARHLRENNVHAKLICAPMENDCGIPENYFDVVYSIYAVGWTSDLQHTLKKLASYLKPGGTLIFSWRHPLHACVQMENGRAVLAKSYFDDSFTGRDSDGNTLYFYNYRISDYVCALTQAGFCIEQLVEQSNPAVFIQENSPATAEKAKLVPLSFIFKARKL